MKNFKLAFSPLIEINTQNNQFFCINYLFIWLEKKAQYAVAKKSMYSFTNSFIQRIFMKYLSNSSYTPANCAGWHKTILWQQLQSIL